MTLIEKIKQAVVSKRLSTYTTSNGILFLDAKELLEMIIQHEQTQKQDTPESEGK